MTKAEFKKEKLQEMLKEADELTAIVIASNKKANNPKSLFRNPNFSLAKQKSS